MITPGSCLGKYEVLGPLGSGGMGEVFRARDSRLGRDVALKVLSEPFKLDPHRLSRFEREARVLASLNHPNIAALHEIAELGDSHALVLELVEGETLAERIERGPIPLPQTLAIAQQIAGALDAAHEHGVVHRDLKPANVKLRPDGVVKLLDFGLAKVFDPASNGTQQAAATSTAIDFAAGDLAVLGTPAYMSPEQARGLPLDKRTDVWAFGCVLFEMLTGERAFGGDRLSDVVARIIEREPNFVALPADVPRIVQRLLRRCLAKDPQRRLRDMGDVRMELIEAIETGADEVPATVARATVWRRVAIAATTVAAISAAIVVAAVRFAALEPDRPTTPSRVARFSIPAQVSTFSGQAVAISADGTHVVYTTDRGLVVRPRDRFDATVVEGLAGAGAGNPFFSPDGEMLGFTDGQMLKKVSVSGGSPIPITTVGAAAMSSWSGDDIVYADMHGVYRVSADGDEPAKLITMPNLLEQAVSPQLLPSREAVIVTIIPTRTNTPGSAANAPGARIEAIDLRTGERRIVLHGGGRARYVPTGHLVYAAGGTLYAAPFDLERLEVLGDSTPVVSAADFIDFAVSDEGTLVYHASGIRRNTLVWVDRQGREESLGAPPRPYVYPRLSPDGTQVALDIDGPPDRDIWIWDLRRRALERFTLDSAGNPIPAWSRDGRHLAFGSDRSGVTNLFMQAADGSGEPVRLLESDRIHMPLGFAPDGRLLFSADVPGQQRDIHALSLDGSRRVKPVVYGPANDLTAEVSPDGKWIAYCSDVSGQIEVYVRPYPDVYGGGRWQISAEGGRQPLWSRDGSELFYRDFDGAMMAASVTTDPTFVPGPAVELFKNSSYAGSGSSGSGRTYDLSLDGDRFLMIKTEESMDDAAPPSLVVVLNWFDELQRLVPLP